MNLYGRTSSYYARARYSTVPMALFCLACAVWSASAPLPSVEASLSSRRKDDRLEAAQQLRQRRGRASAEAVRRALRGEADEMLRVRLTQALAAQAVPGVQDDLAASLGTDASPQVRQAAAQELGRYVRLPGVVTALAGALRKDAAPAVRYACALSLALSDTSEAAAALDWAARQADPDLRRQAAFSLRRHSGSQSRKTLERLRGDADESVRRTASGAQP